MLGGLAFIALAVLGYMGVSALVILPVVLACGAAWVFRPHRGVVGAAPGWSWGAYLRGLPLVAVVAGSGYGAGLAAALLQG